jgi:hypothetical protein
MTTMNATDGQLELGFGGIKISPMRHESGVARANWWFSKMRETVANAMDWSVTAEPRPEQIWMPGAHREIKV